MHPETEMTLATIRQSELRQVAAYRRPAPVRHRLRSRWAGRPTRTEGAR